MRAAMPYLVVSQECTQLYTYGTIQLLYTFVHNILTGYDFYLDGKTLMLEMQLGNKK